MTNAAIIVAAGRGRRAAPDRTGPPKQYALIGGEPVLTQTLRIFSRHRNIDQIQVVIHPDDRRDYDKAVMALDTGERAKIRPPVTGGDSRQQSVLSGLVAFATAPPDLILIHDAARPFVSKGVISAVINALGQRVGAIAALPLADTLKRASDDQTIAGTVDRQRLWRAQTPQGFRYVDILEAHQRAAASGHAASGHAASGPGSFTDDAAIAEWAGLKVLLVEDSAENIKLTTAEDLAMANAATATDTRSGTGFDVHRFTAGDHLWLCGVKIAFDKSLMGHSDADVGLHALTDALLGAIGDGDIGTHFPPDDPQWKGAASDQFLADAAHRVRSRGGRISNVDVTLICEQPKIGPHREAMRAAIARILGIDIARVSVKATTSEGLGFTGRGEGIAAMASASVAIPARD